MDRTQLRLESCREFGDFGSMERKQVVEADGAKIRPHDRATVRTHLFAPVLQRGENRGGLTQGEHGMLFLQVLEKVGGRRVAYDFKGFG